MRWNVRITDHLKLAGICQLKSESCAFKSADGSVILGLYVDEGSVILGLYIDEGSVILGLYIDEGSVILGLYVDDGILVGKDCRVVIRLLDGTVAQLLGAYNMTEAKPPAVERKEEKEGQNKTFPYRELLGSLTYLSSKTRPDIAYAVNRCSRSVENPTKEDIVSIKQVLRYLRGTENLGIRFGGSFPMEELVGFCDDDFVGDPQSRRSTTGYVIYYCGGPISWCTRKQPVVALSTAEAEYTATAECTKELIYLKAVLEEILVKEVTARLHEHYWIPLGVIHGKTSVDKMGAGHPTDILKEVGDTLVKCFIAKAQMGFPCDKEELITLVQQ
ncbi:hypothetical protein PR048_017503, partial [Dryococelus australis]